MGVKHQVAAIYLSKLLIQTHAGLTSLPPDVPPNTRELWLQNNTIKTLDKMPYLQHLHDLKLSSNNVQDLPEDLLVFMRNLRLLYLDDNWLAGLVPHLGNVKQIRLAGNPFRCDCNTLWMKNWLLTHQVGNVCLTLLLLLSWW